MIGAAATVLVSVAGVVAAVWGLLVLGSDDAARDEVIARLSIAGVSVILITSLYLYWIVRIPAEWDASSKEETDALEHRLRPTLFLSFDASQDIRRIQDGTINRSLSGNKGFFIRTERKSVLVDVQNLSSVVIRDAMILAEAFRITTDGKEVTLTGLGPAELVWALNDAKQIEFPPGNSRKAVALTQVNEYEQPLLEMQKRPFDYNFLFMHAGTYKLRITAFAPSTTSNNIDLMFTLETNKIKVNSRQRVTYTITSVWS